MKWGWTFFPHFVRVRLDVPAWARMRAGHLSTCANPTIPPPPSIPPPSSPSPPPSPPPPPNPPLRVHYYSEERELISYNWDTKGIWALLMPSESGLGVAEHCEHFEHYDQVQMTDMALFWDSLSAFCKINNLVSDDWNALTKPAYWLVQGMISPKGRTYLQQNLCTP